MAKQRLTVVKPKPPSESLFRPFATAVDGDDDRADLDPAELAREEDEQVESATEAAFVKPANPEVEKLLERMTEIAETARGKPDARVKRLIAWIRERMLTGTAWTGIRVLIFTEYEATLTYLRDCLSTAFAGTDRPDLRIALYRGSTSQPEREDYYSEPRKLDHG